MESYSAQVSVDRTKWSDDHGADWQHQECITCERVAPCPSIITLLAAIERMVGRKLSLKLCPDQTSIAEDNWIDDGYLYDITVLFFITSSYDMSSYLTKSE